MQILTLSKIQPSTGNLRKNFDDATIAGLAQSIKTDGLLQNLIVGKPKGKKKMHPIICGERRFRALALLQEQGDLPEDYEATVPVVCAAHKSFRFPNHPRYRIWTNCKLNYQFV